MKIGIHFVICIAVAAIVVAAAALGYNAKFGSAAGEAKIVVSPASHDFGNMPQQAVEKVFDVRNTGSKMLEITRISTSCGCTTAEIDLNRIEPNGTARLTVRFDPNSMEPVVTGKVERVVYIRSNDPEQPELEIEIRAFVVG